MALPFICAKIAGIFRIAIWNCCGKTVSVKLNLELACASDVVAIACRVKPDQATLVPERREEVTTEGGLDVKGQRKAVTEAVKQLHDAGIYVSLFLDPDPLQLELAQIDRRRCGGTAHRPLLFGQARQRARQGIRRAGCPPALRFANGAWRCTPGTA